MRKVFYNGTIYTGEKKLYADYVIIEDNFIVEVGDGFDEERYCKEGAELIDLKGRMLLPGFIDAHAHPFTSAFQMSQMVLSFDMGKDEILRTVKTHIEENPENDSYFGIGYREHVFGDAGPNKGMLDRICADKPVILVGASGHEAWVNSKALERAGVDRSTPDPIPDAQFYKRDDEGNPSGHLIESAPITNVIKAVDPFVMEKAEQTLLKILRDFSSYGITTIVDCGFIPYIKERAEQLLDKFIQKGLLPQRIFGSNHINELAELEGWQDYLYHMRCKYNTDYVRFNTWKVINDGIVEARSASMTEPFSGMKKTSPPLLYGETLHSLCVEAASLGYDIHLHGIGDHTVHENLMAAKAVRDAGYEDTIITNAHTQCVLKSDIPLFARLKVIANTTGVWHYGDLNAVELLGKRADETFPLYSIVKAGARMSLGSDFPGDEYGPQPLNSIETGATRQLCGQPDSPVLQPEEERLPISELIKGFTETAAFQVRMDKKIGTIKAGKYADLVVLDQNLFDVNPYDIHKIKVCMTIMDGNITYQDQDGDFCLK